MHHRTNRVADVPDLYFKENKPNRLSYYFDILGGFYWLYCFSLCFLSFLPQKNLHRVIKYIIKNNKNRRKELLYVQAENLFNNKAIVIKARWDTLFLLVFFIFSFVCFSVNSLLTYWIILQVTRALFFSYLNNMPHYGNPLDQLNASDSSWLPKSLACLYLNFNYHKIHHEKPTIPWHHLPSVFKENNGSYDKNYIKEYFAQLKGPIYYKNLKKTDEL